MQAGGTVLGTSTVKVGGKTAYRIDVRGSDRAPDGSVDTFRFSEVIVAYRGDELLITVTASDDVAGARFIDHILGSVRHI